MPVTIKDLQVTASVSPTRPGDQAKAQPVDPEALKRDILEACEDLIEAWHAKRERP